MKEDERGITLTQERTSARGKEVLVIDNKADLQVFNKTILETEDNQVSIVSAP